MPDDVNERLVNMGWRCRKILHTLNAVSRKILTIELLSSPTEMAMATGFCVVCGDFIAQFEPGHCGADFDHDAARFMACDDGHP